MLYADQAATAPGCRRMTRARSATRPHKRRDGNSDRDKQTPHTVLHHLQAMAGHRWPDLCAAERFCHQPGGFLVGRAKCRPASPLQASSRQMSLGSQASLFQPGCASTTKHRPDGPVQDGVRQDRLTQLTGALAPASALARASSASPSRNEQVAQPLLLAITRRDQCCAEGADLVAAVVRFVRTDGTGVLGLG
jgi:hypothetical protein